MISITLPDDIEAWAREQVAAGRAGSVNGFITQALRDLRMLQADHREAVEAAYKSVAEGKLIDEADMDTELDRWIAEDLAAKG